MMKSNRIIYAALIAFACATPTPRQQAPSATQQLRAVVKMQETHLLSECEEWWALTNASTFTLSVFYCMMVDGIEFRDLGEKATIDAVSRLPATTKLCLAHPQVADQVLEVCDKRGSDAKWAKFCELRSGVSHEMAKFRTKLKTCRTYIYEMHPERKCRWGGRDCPESSVCLRDWYLKEGICSTR